MDIMGKTDPYSYCNSIIKKKVGHISIMSKRPLTKYEKHKMSQLCPFCYGLMDIRMSDKTVICYECNLILP